MASQLVQRKGSVTHKKQERIESCFVLMPFSPEFDEVYRVIKSVLEAIGLNCSRADETAMAGNVVTQILQDIHKADMIIADLTGKNANVFYETGHAHATKDPEKVIILAQRGEDVPFDLQALRYIKYDNNRLGRKLLHKRLSEFVRQGKTTSGGLFETIEGSPERTRRIVADLAAVLKNRPSFVESLTIRVQAGLSSIAICENEPGAVPERRKDTARLLVRERNLLRDAIQKGATAKVILCPPTSRVVTQSKSFAYLRPRYERLISLLEGKNFDESDSPFRSERCKFVLSPFRGNNLLILGQSLFYEGVKVDIAGGFDLTSRVTHSGSVAARIHAFDRLFEDSRAYTVKYYGRRQSNRMPRHRELQLAVLKGVREAYRDFQK